MAYIGIDCGTQSLKVLVWDPISGKSYACSRSYGLIEGLPPGHKEQDPQIWIDALNECFQQLRAEEIPLSHVKAIGVSGQQHGLVVLDQNDRILRPAKLWNDTSTGPQCREIVEAAGGLEAYQKEIGNSLPPGFTASKILWIRQNEPETYARIHSFMLPHDYLNFYLTGEKTAEAGDASGTGYFKVREREWSLRTLKWIDPGRDLSEGLPRLIDSMEPAGKLREPLAREWGLSPSTIVSSGGGDNMMGAIGSGNVETGIVTVSLGTSGTLYSCSPTPVIDPRGEIAAFCDSTGNWLPLGCTMNVTVATEMVRKSLVNEGHSEFNQLIGSISPGSDGLFMVPFLEGERMPSVPSGTGVLMGLRPATCTPGHLARAAMEGVTMGLRYGLDRMRELGIHPSEIRLIGGGAKSQQWREIAADILNTETVCPRTEEGPAFGAALQAMWAHQEGQIKDLASQFLQLNEESRVAPSRKGAETYERLYELYDQLSSQLTASGIFDQHRQFIDQM
jgi:xylulokinase